MSPRELRLRQRIDDLMDENERLACLLKNAYERNAYWRKKAGASRPYLPVEQRTPRYRVCECGSRCRGERCWDCRLAYERERRFAIWEATA